MILKKIIQYSIILLAILICIKIGNHYSPMIHKLAEMGEHILGFGLMVFVFIVCFYTSRLFYWLLKKID